MWGSVLSLTLLCFQLTAAFHVSQAFTVPPRGRDRLSRHKHIQVFSAREVRETEQSITAPASQQEPKQQSSLQLDFAKPTAADQFRIAKRKAFRPPPPPPPFPMNLFQGLKRFGQTLMGEETGESSPAQHPSVFEFETETILKKKLGVSVAVAASTGALVASVLAADAVTGFSLTMMSGAWAAYESTRESTAGAVLRSVGASGASLMQNSRLGEAVSNAAEGAFGTSFRLSSPSVSVEGPLKALQAVGATADRVLDTLAKQAQERLTPSSLDRFYRSPLAPYRERRTELIQISPSLFILEQPLSLPDSQTESENAAWRARNIVQRCVVVRLSPPSPLAPAELVVINPVAATAEMMALLGSIDGDVRHVVVTSSWVPHQVYVRAFLDSLPSSSSSSSSVKVWGLEGSEKFQLKGRGAVLRRLGGGEGLGDLSFRVSRKVRKGDRVPPEWRGELELAVTSAGGEETSAVVLFHRETGTLIAGELIADPSGRFTGPARRFPSSDLNRVLPDVWNLRNAKLPPPTFEEEAEEEGAVAFKLESSDSGGTSTTAGSRDKKSARPSTLTFLSLASGRDRQRIQQQQAEKKLRLESDKIPLRLRRGLAAQFLAGEEGGEESDLASALVTWPFRQAVASHFASPVDDAKVKLLDLLRDAAVARTQGQTAVAPEEAAAAVSEVSAGDGGQHEASEEEEGVAVSPKQQTESVLTETEIERGEEEEEEGADRGGGALTLLNYAEGAFKKGPVWGYLSGEVKLTPWEDIQIREADLEAAKEALRQKEGARFVERIRQGVEDQGETLSELQMENLSVEEEGKEGSRPTDETSVSVQPEKGVESHLEGVLDFASSDAQGKGGETEGDQVHLGGRHPLKGTPTLSLGLGDTREEEENAASKSGKEDKSVSTSTQPSDKPCKEEKDKEEEEEQEDPSPSPRSA